MRRKFELSEAGQGLLWEIGSALTGVSTEEASAVLTTLLEKVATHLSVEVIGCWHNDYPAGTSLLQECWEQQGTLMPMSTSPVRKPDLANAEAVLSNNGVAYFGLQNFFSEEAIPLPWRNGSVMVVLIEFTGDEADVLVMHRPNSHWTDEEIEFCRSLSLALRQFLARVHAERKLEKNVALARLVTDLQQRMSEADHKTSAAAVDAVLRQIEEQFDLLQLAVLELRDAARQLYALGRPVHQRWFETALTALPFDPKSKAESYVLVSSAELALEVFGADTDVAQDLPSAEALLIPIGVADGPARTIVFTRDGRTWEQEEIDALVAVGRSMGEMLARTDVERLSQVQMRVQEAFSDILSSVVHSRGEEPEHIVQNALARIAQSVGAEVVAIVDTTNPAPTTCGRVLTLWESDDSKFDVGAPVRFPESWVNQAILAQQPVVTSIQISESLITGRTQEDAEWTLVCVPLPGWQDGAASIGMLLRDDETPWGTRFVEWLTAFGELLSELKFRIDAEQAAEWQEETAAYLRDAASTLHSVAPERFANALDAVLERGANLFDLPEIELWSVNTKSEKCRPLSAPLRPLFRADDSTIGPLLSVAHSSKNLIRNRHVFLPLESESHVFVLAVGPLDERVRDAAVPLLESLLVVIERAERRVTAERRAKLAFNESPIGVLLCDSEFKLITCNEAFASFLGFATPDEVVATGIEAALTVLQGKFSAGAYELPFNRVDGAEVWGRIHATPLEGVGTGHETWLVHVEDATDRRHDEEVLRHQASTDELTGLANRRVLTSRLNETIHDGSAPTVLLLDLDRFKAVNDSLGHDQGDELLRIIADRLRLAVRPGDLVARLGGDEFAILLASPSDTTDADIVADRLVELLDEPVILVGQTIQPAASIGIAKLDLPTSGSEVLRAADTAMYQAKAAGGSGHATFDQKTQSKPNEALQIEGGLRHAIERGELSVHYQPEIALDTGRILGAEALVRWEHPLRGLMHARSFLHIAEDAGLLSAIGSFVLRAACVEAASWADQDTLIRVNLAASQLHQADMVTVIGEALTIAGLDPQRLCIEVTEASMTQDLERSEHVLSGLRSLGVRIALDDFGTSFASLAHLKRFGVDTIKIDRSLVRGLDSPNADDLLVRSIVSLAAALELEVVAEGIETQAQAEALLRAGCTRAQGYFYAPPMPTSELMQRFSIGNH
jgi:diguanylate cyclase (GGDEF)-like protein